MTSGSVGNLDELPDGARALLEQARRGILSTRGIEGPPYTVPVCYVTRGAEIVTPIDHKPKSGRVLARVRNIEKTGVATLLVDRWNEDWDQLAWIMARCSARVAASDEEAERMLLEKYPQFGAYPHHDALLVLLPARVSWWTYA